ncbi:MAG: leucine-rich repeat domain-containing protein, partial [Sedimentisphaerales bacterium]|nr:leucine-rich repeat domain-containing protein [Sedimentisphaerales bacterium]
MKSTLPRVIYCLAALSALLCACAIGQPPHYLPDPALRAVVGQALGVANPTPLEMLALISLDASYKGVTDLTGLNYAINLQDLNLQGNKIHELDALADLVNLKYLNLRDNRIGDLRPLLSLHNLVELDIRGNLYPYPLSRQKIVEFKIDSP